ncbi:SIR2 family protein [Thauera sp. Sel9]|uniref:SIR2 family protein n=1 Tax=Thauera sp. Sel9 TaxID=2974299 RepID=UPI0021E12C94|nr:SIR2 family protein [Thauera sp. Sel9]MCV2217735.1 SIR2 family protein [Thauera sp. Sel9]
MQRSQRNLEREDNLLVVHQLTVDALVRSIGVARDRPLLVFLGAGASMSSGMPSADQCLWEWKRSIFLTNNPGLEAQFSELSLPSVRHRIQAWLDSRRKYPPEGSPEEYSVYIEECFARSDDRRMYFERWVKQSSPYLGYQLLAELARQGMIASVWTTNFDGLAARAAVAAGITVTEIGIDCQQRLYRNPGEGEMQCISLHGDYRYDALKNTRRELEEQETELRKVLLEKLRTHPVLVCGYSGRDRSVMQVFYDAYRESAGKNPLYWAQYGDSDPPSEVRRLISANEGTEPFGYHIPNVVFDDLMRRLVLHVTSQEDRERIELTLSRFKADPVSQRTAFSLPSLPVTGLVKSNAFPMVPPREIIEFDLLEWPAPGTVWSTLREIGDRHGFVAAPFRGKVYAMATIDQLKAAFGANVNGTFNRVAISDEDLRYEDGTGNQLMRRAVVISLSRAEGCRSDLDSLIWDANAYKQEKLDERLWQVHQAVILQAKTLADGLALVMKPTLFVSDRQGNAAPIEVERALKVKVLGYQHNKEFNEALEMWRNRLLPHRDVQVRFPDVENGITFSISSWPLFARITDERSGTVKLTDSQERAAPQVGLQLSEPKLTFASSTGAGLAEDTHPVRGLLQNRPFDALLTEAGISTKLRVAIIAPAKDARRVHQYLSQLHGAVDPTKYDSDYLLSFPGFSAAFKCSLEIAEPGQRSFVELVEPTEDSPSACRMLGVRIASALSSLKAAESPSVTFIYIPTRWHGLRGYELENERFDLHDFVKSSAIPLGCSTQFLEEDTLNNLQQCRVRWWLSLAIYAKGMRTPWALKELDKDSAYVGIGFSLRPKGEGPGHVVLGCSHLYSPSGHGLQFRLSKIEEPIMRRKNAFMSFEDARRLGEGIRELFFNAHLRLPRRIVVHKQTPFLKAEREGLQAGLQGVDCVELLQIYVDDTLRYLASRPNKGGGFGIDNFPIRRGTTIVVDDQTALLWVHGASTALNPKLTYYQGKRRIPAPLVLVRHAGTSELMQLADEVLGLSKMNFNSFDLYGQLPATIETSRRVAAIGALLDRYSDRSYDYRLFM